MELKLFTDLIDALGKVAGGLKAIVNLPKAEREAMRRTLNETYKLNGTTHNMMIIRLGNILLHAADDDVLCEAARWITTSHGCRPRGSLRLCHGKGASA